MTTLSEEVSTLASNQCFRFEFRAKRLALHHFHRR